MQNRITIFVIILALVSYTHLSAQCSDDTHSSNSADAWESCTTTLCPNSVRGIAHWQLYDLGHVYQFKDMRIWNYNVADETNKGFRNLVIDYSLDGSTWTQATTFELPQASGNPTYTGYTSSDLSGIQARYVLLTALSTWGSASCAGLSELRFEVEGVALSVRAMLQGAYDPSTGQMRDDLRTNGLLPTQEPYTADGYLHIGQGGGEATSAIALDVKGNTAIVDWVVLEIRDAVDPSITLASRSCLLRRDGQIVDTDGISAVHFTGIAAGDYHVAVRHRNHLAVMTEAVVSLEN